jgi:hypothetical protein
MPGGSTVRAAAATIGNVPPREAETFRLEEKEPLKAGAVREIEDLLPVDTREGTRKGK